MQLSTFPKQSLLSNCLSVARPWNRNPYFYLSFWLTTFAASSPAGFSSAAIWGWGAHSGPLPWDTMRVPSLKIEVSFQPALPDISRFSLLYWIEHTHSKIAHTLLQKNDLHPAEKCCRCYLSTISGRLHSRIWKSNQGWHVYVCVCAFVHWSNIPVISNTLLCNLNYGIFKGMVCHG